MNEIMKNHVKEIEYKKIEWEGKTFYVKSLSTYKRDSIIEKCMVEESEESRLDLSLFRLETMLEALYDENKKKVFPEKDKEKIKNGVLSDSLQNLSMEVMDKQGIEFEDKKKS